MLANFQNTVERMVRIGHPFDDVENYIDATALPEELKAALWLLAWSYQPGPCSVVSQQEALGHVGQIRA